MTTANDAGNGGTQGNAGAGGDTSQQQGAQGNQQQGSQGAADERYGAPAEGTDYTVPASAKDFDPALTSTIKAYAREHNLSDKAASKLFEAAASYGTSSQKALAAAHEQNLANWKTTSAQDKEFGGEAFEANRAVMAKGLETFATPELRKIVSESGLDNHPEFARFFYRVGKAVNEDKFVRGGSNNQPANTGIFTYDKSDHRQ
jgi:hypothetical protein